MKDAGSTFNQDLPSCFFVVLKVNVFCLKVAKLVCTGVKFSF